MSPVKIEHPALPPLLAQIDLWVAQGGRRLVGVVGPPGSGKSTLAEALHAARPQTTCVVPMDGFHLAQATLERLGRAARKGAPDTFDGDGYVALLQRIRGQGTDGTVWAPAFDRHLEEGIAGAIGIAPDVPVVLTEGNYLLLDEPPWHAVAPCLDACWYVEVDPALRLQRLLARHVAHGRNHDEALAWIASTDEPNTRRIEASKPRATALIEWR